MFLRIVGHQWPGFAIAFWAYSPLIKVALLDDADASLSSFEDTIVFDMNAATSTMLSDAPDDVHHASSVHLVEAQRATTPSFHSHDHVDDDNDSLSSSYEDTIIFAMDDVDTEASSSCWYDTSSMKMRAAFDTTHRASTHSAHRSMTGTLLAGTRTVTSTHSEGAVGSGDQLVVHGGATSRVVLLS